MRSCCEKRFEEKLCKRHQKSPTVVKVVENKFDQVVEKSFDFVLCLFGFVEAKKFRDSNKYSDCVQNVSVKSCLPCQILYINQKKKTNLQSAKRPRYEFSATVLRRTCKYAVYPVSSCKRR